MLAYLNEFHDYFKLYLPNTFLVMFIMFNHSLKRWHSSVGLTILSTCKWNYCNNYNIRLGLDAIGGEALGAACWTLNSRVRTPLTC